MLARDYRPSDLVAMWELDQQCFPPGIAYSRSELRAFLADRTAEAIVVEHGGRIVAFVLGTRRRADGHVVTLDVAAPARRQGLGRRLMLELEARFRARGVTRMRLEVAATNRVAIALYQRLGYRKVEVLRAYYGRGLDAWTMEKALGEPATGRCRPSPCGDARPVPTAGSPARP
jgi:ribosomal-protein-alanine N-acetyltransferase